MACMAYKSNKSVPAAFEQKAPVARKITLTSAKAESVSVGVSELIAYSSQTGFTRLNLTGRKTLDVKETTEQIDRLMRNVAAKSGAFTPVTG
jgi:hypothetical protein